MTKSSEYPFTDIPCPDFVLKATGGDGAGGQEVSLDGLRGSWAVIFVYPSDDTETCTKENLSFSEQADAFAARSTRLYGLSPDDLKSHEKFIRKHGLKVDLVSDPDHVLIDGLGVWIEKSLYGRSYMGVDRSTWIIDPSGRIRASWRAVRVKDHVTRVLSALDTLQGK